MIVIENRASKPSGLIQRPEGDYYDLAENEPSLLRKIFGFLRSRGGQTLSQNTLFLKKLGEILPLSCAQRTLQRLWRFR